MVLVKVELTCKCPKCGNNATMAMADIAAIMAAMKDDDWHVECITGNHVGADRIWLVKGEGVVVSQEIVERIN